MACLTVWFPEVTGERRGENEFLKPSGKQTVCSDQKGAINDIVPVITKSPLLRHPMERETGTGGAG